MPEQQLFEYAVLRVVPRVEREEFINVGVILFSKDLKFLDCRISLRSEKLRMLCAEVDCNEVQDYLTAFERICRGDTAAGPIAAFDLPSRFRWLTATRSTVVQCSKVHPGRTDHPLETLERLFAKLVL